jgi:hypothetical protein
VTADAWVGSWTEELAASISRPQALSITADLLHRNILLLRAINERLQRKKTTSIFAVGPP